MSITYNRTADVIDIRIKAAKDIAKFKEVMFRATNLWPDAPPNIKELADLVQHGKILQDYKRQDTSAGKQLFAEEVTELEEQGSVSEINPAPSVTSTEQEYLMYKTFQTEILAMNTMYELPMIGDTAEAIYERAIQFKKILGDELNEIDEIILEAAGRTTAGNETSADILRLRTGMADLLGDIVVFCVSEAARYDIPLDGVLRIIMQSNFSKLGEDGNPIKDKETGKFLKGPNYWKPEPMIAKLLLSYQPQMLETAGGQQQVQAITIDMDAVVQQAVTEKTADDATTVAATPEAAPATVAVDSGNLPVASHP